MGSKGLVSSVGRRRKQSKKRSGLEERVWREERNDSRTKTETQPKRECADPHF